MIVDIHATAFAGREVFHSPIEGSGNRRQVAISRVSFVSISTGAVNQVKPNLTVFLYIAKSAINSVGPCPTQIQCPFEDRINATPYGFLNEVTKFRGSSRISSRDWRRLRKTEAPTC
jgi:hypothetical protein